MAVQRVDPKLDPDLTLAVREETKKTLYKIAVLFGVANIAIALGGLVWIWQQLDDFRVSTGESVKRQLVSDAKIIVDRQTSEYLNSVSGRVAAIEKSADLADSTIRAAYGRAENLNGQVDQMRRQSDRLVSHIEGVQESVDSILTTDTQEAADFLRAFNSSTAANTLSGYVKTEELDEEIEILKENIIDTVSSTALSQCKIEQQSEWKKGCAAGSVLSTGFASKSDGESTWSGWNVTSEWDGEPHSCLRIRIVCE